jgi:hypothetical protein
MTVPCELSVQVQVSDLESVVLSSIQKLCTSFHFSGAILHLFLCKG